MMNQGTRFPFWSSRQMSDRALYSGSDRPQYRAATAAPEPRIPAGSSSGAPRLLRIPHGTNCRQRLLGGFDVGKDDAVNARIQHALDHPGVLVEFPAVRGHSRHDGLRNLEVAGARDGPGIEQKLIYVRSSVTSNGLCSMSYIMRSMSSLPAWLIAAIGEFPVPLKLAVIPKTTLPSSSRLTSWFSGADWRLG